MHPNASERIWTVDQDRSRSIKIWTVDQDLGRSGGGTTTRAGFEQVLAEVSMGHVGLVLSLEMSRPSRCNKDWAHLIEVCALFDTLLADQDGIYDATDLNDRLLLGLKGTMNAFAQRRGPGRGRATPAIPRRHGRRPHDHRIRTPGAGDDGRPGAGPHPRRGA
jgi:DNA invertase Pin-like site-specific DNA recombinase